MSHIPTEKEQKEIDAYNARCEEQENFINQLISVANIYEAHIGNPALPVPSANDWKSLLYGGHWFYGDDSEKQTKKAARSILKQGAKVAQGKIVKEYTDGYLRVYIPLTDTITIKHVFDREKVCRLVDTGEVKIVKKEEVVVPAVTRTVEVEEPVTAWDCGSLMK